MTQLFNYLLYDFSYEKLTNLLSNTNFVLIWQSQSVCGLYTSKEHFFFTKTKNVNFRFA